MHQFEANKQNQNIHRSFQKLGGDITHPTSGKFIDNRPRQLQQIQLKKVIQKVTSIPANHDEETRQHSSYWFALLNAIILMSDPANSAKITSRNTAEWIKNNGDKLFLHTPACSASGVEHNKNDIIDFFPTYSYLDARNSSANSCNRNDIVRNCYGYEGWQSNGEIHIISSPHYTIADIKKKLVHEIQHQLDQNQDSGLLVSQNRLNNPDAIEAFRVFKTEFNAFLYSNHFADVAQVNRNLTISTHVLREYSFKNTQGMEIKLEDFYSDSNNSDFKGYVNNYINNLIMFPVPSIAGNLYASGFNPLNSVRLENLYKIINIIQSDQNINIGSYHRLLNAITWLDQDDRNFILVSPEMQFKINACRTTLTSSHLAQFNRLIAQI